MSADFLKAMSEPPTVAAKPEASIKRVPSVTLLRRECVAIAFAAAATPRRASKNKKLDVPAAATRVKGAASRPS